MQPVELEMAGTSLGLHVRTHLHLQIVAYEYEYEGLHAYATVLSTPARGSAQLVECSQSILVA